MMARIGVSSLMPLATFVAELARVGVEVQEILPDPSDHPYAGHVLHVSAPKLDYRAFRHLIGDAKVAALAYLRGELAIDPEAAAA